MSDPREVITRASQLGGPGSVPALADGDVFAMPTFEYEFKSEAWPKANGPIVLRYPTMRDEVDIERRAVMDGGTLVARALAAVFVCIETAPASWWRPSSAPDGYPVPAPDRLPCTPEVVEMWTRWLMWRDSFRSIVPGPGSGGAV